MQQLKENKVELSVPLVVDMEEGKSWYDLLRVGRYTDPTGGINFITEFFIPYVINYNGTASENKVKATLLDKNAWYLPVNETEMTRNPKLKQNPYYE